MEPFLPPPTHAVADIVISDGKRQPGRRYVAEETPIAFVYEGGGETGMMAMPQDLEGFAYGFSPTEGIIEGIGDIRSLAVVLSELGIELRIESEEASYFLPDGCVGAYYPEANPPIPLRYHDPLSRTPAAEGVPMRIRTGTRT